MKHGVEKSLCAVRQHNISCLHATAAKAAAALLFSPLDGQYCFKPGNLSTIRLSVFIYQISRTFFLQETGKIVLAVHARLVEVARALFTRPYERLAF